MRETIKESLTCILTEEEMAKLAAELGGLQRDLEQLKTTRKTIVELIALKSATAITGEEKRMIECIWEPDYDLGLTRLIRQDTFREVRSYVMTDDERQQTLFGNQGSDQSSESSEPESAETSKETQSAAPKTPKCSECDDPAIARDSEGSYFCQSDLSKAKGEPEMLVMQESPAQAQKRILAERDGKSAAAGKDDQPSLVMGGTVTPVDDMSHANRKRGGKRRKTVN